jgi:hypothetical protein
MSSLFKQLAEEYKGRSGEHVVALLTLVGPHVETMKALTNISHSTVPFVLLETLADDLKALATEIARVVDEELYGDLSHEPTANQDDSLPCEG